MNDAINAKSEDVPVELIEVAKVDAKTQYKLIVKPDQTWMKDPSRVYPITIDPCIEVLD